VVEILRAAEWLPVSDDAFLNLHPLMQTPLPSLAWTGKI
jgi:hypothetical protein